MKFFYVLGVVFIFLSCSSVKESVKVEDRKEAKAGADMESAHTEGKKEASSGLSRISHEEAKKVKANCSKGMCEIPAGEFMMGCNKDSKAKCYPNESPYHKVYLDSYKIDEHEVRVVDFMECVSAKKCSKKNFGVFSIHDTSNNYGNKEKLNHPMNSVSWYGANEYCKFVGKRLPTEAEWEKAARGGTDTAYFWGDNVWSYCNYSHIGENKPEYETCGHGYKMTSPVKMLKANQHGLYDILGNVAEWVSDSYNAKYYEKSPFKNPKYVDKKNGYVFRGSGWGYYDPEYLSVSLRGQGLGDVTNFHSIGFRCVK